MTDREKIANENLQKIAKYIQENLPEGMGFVVLTFDFNEKGRMMYVSNANRDDVVDAMDEFKAKVQTNDFGKHKDAEDKVWYNIQELLELKLDGDTAIWCLNKLNYNDFLTTMRDLSQALVGMGPDAMKAFQFSIVGKGENNAK